MRRQFFRVLRKYLAFRDEHLPSDSSKLITQSTIPLIRKNTEASYGAAEKYHLELACLVLETFNYLKRYQMDSDVLDGALMAAVTTPNRRLIQWAVKLRLAFADDPMRSLVNYSESRVPRRYGKLFTFKQQGSQTHSYTIQVTNCFYHRFFSSHGAPELTHYFCEWDRSWIEPISERKHKVMFRRETTIADGGSSCPFHFERVDE